jgi:hypothetical protein
MILMKLKAFLVVLLSANVLISYAQKELRLKSRTALPSTARNITSSFINKTCGDYIRVFELLGNTKKIEKGQFAGMDFVQRHVGLIFPTGTEYMFESNEQLSSETNGYLLTIKSDFDSDLREITSYRLTSGSVIQTGRTKAYSIEGSDYLLNNGNVISTDLSEGFGTRIEILSPELKSLNTFEPIAGGYGDCLLAADDKTIFAVVKNDALTKLFVINPLTGQIEKNLTIPYSGSLQTLYGASGKVLIYGDQHLTSINLNGEVTWSITLTLPYFDFFLEGDRAVAFTTTGIVSLNSTSGSIEWQLDYSKLIQSEATHSVIPKSLSFDISKDGMIAVILSTNNQSTPITYANTSTCSVFIIDNRGNLIEKIALPNAQNPKVIYHSNTLQVFQSSEVLNYEKTP